MEAGCCDDLDVSTVHPMIDRPARRVGQFTLFDAAASPILVEIQDAGELKDFFKKWNFVPFRGSDRGTGHAVLSLLDRLYRQSPTHRGCIEKLSTYAFGTAATTIRADNTEFDTGAELQPPTEQERELYRTEGLGIVTFDRPLKTFFRQLSNTYQWSGNCWVQLNYTEVNGQPSAFFKIHKPSTVLYLNTDANEPRIVAVSPTFTNEYLDENEPEYLPVFPEFVEVDGVQKCMMHLKDGDYTWYGGPSSEAAIENMFEEQQQTAYRLRSTQGEFSGKIIIETEDSEGYGADPKTAAADQAAFVREFEEQYTNRGANPQGVVIASRPFGAKPMFVHDIPANTNHEYFKGISELDEKEILKAHQVTRKFLSLDSSGRFTSQVGFIEDYVTNMEPVIYDLRHTILSFLNMGLSKVWEMAGREYLNEQSLWFGSPIDVSVEQFKKGLIIPDVINNGQANNNDSAGSNG